MTLNDLIARIYVINLPERRDRKAQISRELQRHGLNWQAGRVMCWPAQRPEDADGFPTAGTRGCFLSHLAALEDAQTLRSGYILVLEDDAVLLPELGRRLDALAGVLQREQPDLLYLGHCRVEGETRKELAPFQACIQAIEGAHAYLINRRLLPSLLAYLRACVIRPAGHREGGRLHYDAALTLFRRFHPECRTWMASPSLVEQRYSRSDIQARWWYDQWPVIRTLAAFARNLKQFHRHTTV